MQQLFSSDRGGAYYYNGGWNLRALFALVIAAIFSVSAVWVPALGFLNGFDWVLGALLAAVIYLGLMIKSRG